MRAAIRPELPLHGPAVTIDGVRRDVKGPADLRRLETFGEEREDFLLPVCHLLTTCCHLATLERGSGPDLNFRRHHGAIV